MKTRDEYREWLHKRIIELHRLKEEPNPDSVHCAKIVGDAGKLAVRHKLGGGLYRRCQVEEITPVDGVALLGDCLKSLGPKREMATVPTEVSVMSATQVKATVAEAIAESDGEFQLLPNGKPTMTETEVTTRLGLANTTLRDARLRGEVNPGRQGRSYVYTMRDLMEWHENTRQRDG